MLILKIENQYTKLKNVSRKTVRLLKDITSYTVSGSWFAKSYQQKQWDGREKLLKYSDKKGFHFPTGLVADVIEKLDELGIEYKIEQKKRRRAKVREYVFHHWNEKIKMRPYQDEAVTAILSGSHKSLYHGMGILKMPIRSGKTKTVARVIHELAVKTLVIVTSKNLLYQTKESLEESLLCNVGIIGDSKWIEEDVTVATAQTLSGLLEKAKPEKKKNKPSKKADPIALKKWNNFKKKYFCVVFDEVHHLTAETWHRVMMEFDVPYKIGLSATAFPENEKEWERGAIWLKACCGNIRIDIPTTRLIKEGYLLGPTVNFFIVEKPNLMDKGWSQELRSKAIYENEYRNKLITKIAKKYTKKGLLVLVISNRLNQVEILTNMFDKSKISHHTITSRDPSGTRKEKVNDFTSRNVNALIGTVLSEGVDIPEIDVVINAEGGADMKNTIQRMRNLTISQNKKRAYVVDFADLTNGHFAAHSKERLRTYRTEPAFKIKAVTLRDI